MWAKLSSALKQRPETPSPGDLEDDLSHADVLGSIYEQHPNLSVFHEPSEIPFPSPSPPASPSLTGRKGIFKRPKPRIDTTAANDAAASSPIMSPLTLPKKVKHSLQTLPSVSELSLNRPSLESGHRPSLDSNRPSQEKQPGTPTVEGKFSSLRSIMRPSTESSHTQRPSQESIKISQEKPPITPTTDAKFASLRSILRDRNTPATGQSVRFFSRDAYKMISPDVSSASSEPEEISFAARLQRAKQQPRPAAQELFSLPGTPSLMTHMPPPDVSNIFDLSTDAELPAIPAGMEAPLLDSAVEISEADPETTTTAKEDERPPTPPAKSPSTPHGLHDRSHSFSFGQTVFRSLGNDSSGPSSSSISKANRSRALSDTVFHSLISSPVGALENQVPEADINDTSGAMIVYASPEREKEKDPFGANATTYYTPGTVLPPTPPHVPNGGHGRKASREEDLIWSLRTQLALQSELCVQFEVDLGARDELVRVLNARLEDSERECERRRGVVKNWRKRVSELERCVKGLQEEVDRSREESMERSMMDEASGEALRMLHRKIEALERERAEGEKRENQAREEILARNRDLQQAKEELSRRDESERVLKAGIKAAKEEMEQMGESSGMQEAVARQAQEIEDVERHLAVAEVTWQEERQNLMDDNELQRKECVALHAQLIDAREEIARKDSEISVLKSEVEAQWKHTENASEKIQELNREREELKGEVETLNERISAMEIDWNQTENRKAELESELQEAWAAKDDLEHERTELEYQLRAEHEHSEHLTRTLQEREDHVTTLEQERQYAIDRAARFEAQIKERDSDAVQLSERAAAHEKEAEEAQEEMSRMKRDHARIVNEQSRTLQEVVAREVEARAGLESLVREKAEVDVHLSTLKERLSALQEEVERLRRQVHALQQESADKEVKLVNFAKQRAQDKDDIHGLNIALDSKQQELELLKRRIGVRGTAGSTPAQASKMPHHRRESSIFGTPSMPASRPPSALSEVGSSVKDRKLNDTPSTATKPALGKSVRTNSTVAGTAASKRSLEGSMGPPPALSRNGSVSSSPGLATPTRIPSSSGTRGTVASGAPSAYGTKSTLANAQRRLSTSSVPEPHRLRSTLASREQLTSASETDEKEKENTAPISKTRRMSVAAA